MFVRNHKIAATAITDRNKLHISPGPKFKILHFIQMKIEKNSEYFHDIHGRNLAERHRRVAEREMSHVRKDEPFFKNMMKIKEKARPDRKKIILAELETRDSQSLFQDSFSGHSTSESIPSCAFSRSAKHVAKCGVAALCQTMATLGRMSYSRRRH